MLTSAGKDRPAGLCCIQCKVQASAVLPWDTFLLPPGRAAAAPISDTLSPQSQAYQSRLGLLHGGQEMHFDPEQMQGPSPTSNSCSLEHPPLTLPLPLNRSLLHPPHPQWPLPDTCTSWDQPAQLTTLRDLQWNEEANITPSQGVIGMLYCTFVTHGPAPRGLRQHKWEVFPKWKALPRML